MLPVFLVRAHPYSPAVFSRTRFVRDSSMDKVEEDYFSEVGDGEDDEEAALAAAVPPSATTALPRPRGVRAV